MTGIQKYVPYRNKDYDKNTKQWTLPTGHGYKQVVLRLHGVGATAGTEDKLRQTVNELSLYYRATMSHQMKGIDAIKRFSLMTGTYRLDYNDGGRTFIEFPLVLTPERPKISPNGLQVESGEPFYLEIDWDDDEITDCFDGTPKLDIITKRTKQLEDPRFSYVVRENFHSSGTGDIRDDINIVNHPFRNLFFNFDAYDGNEEEIIRVGYDDLTTILQEDSIEGWFIDTVESYDLDEKAEKELKALDDDERFIVVPFDPMINPKALEFPSFDYKVTRESATEVRVYKEQLRNSEGVE